MGTGTGTFMRTATTTMPAIITNMPDCETGLLALAQWLSPAFPVGAFAYSHGLERAIAAGEVRDAPSLQDWLADLLRFGSGRTDAILLSRAMDADADLTALGEWGFALAGSAEREREAAEQGSAFADTIKALTGEAVPFLPYPVAVGAAARRLRLPARRVAAFYLQGFAGNLVSAAVRLVPLGQTAGQRVLAALRPTIAAIAAEAADAPLGAIGVAAFGAELAAMHHETMSPRMFRT